MPKAPRGPYIDKPFRDALRLAVKRTGDADVKGKTKLDKIAIALVGQAILGDVPAIKEIGDRLDGKVAQALEHKGHDGGALVVTWQPPSE